MNTITRRTALAASVTLPLLPATAYAAPADPAVEAYWAWRAAREAYEMAGITDPFNQFDVAELYIPASTAGVTWMEALGLCDEGGGPRLIRSGVTEMGRELPINPSGGVLATNPIGATGLLRIGEAALQVMGKAEEKQVEGAEVAVATGFGGCFWSDVTVISSLPQLN